MDQRGVKLCSVYKLVNGSAPASSGVPGRLTLVERVGHRTRTPRTRGAEKSGLYENCVRFISLGMIQLELLVELRETWISRITSDIDREHMEQRRAACVKTVFGL